MRKKAVILPTCVNLLDKVSDFRFVMICELVHNLFKTSYGAVMFANIVFQTSRSTSERLSERVTSSKVPSIALF